MKVKSSIFAPWRIFMFRLISILVLSLVIGLPAFAQKKVKPKKKEQPVTAFQELVNAERAFSALSQKSGIKTAFTSNLSDSGVLFRPNPVNGLGWFEAKGETPGTLVWEPEYAEISNSGNFGFTTGPFAYKPDTLDCKIGKCSWGRYLTVWKKNSEGQWKIMIDFGARHPEVQVKKKNVKKIDNSKFLFRVNPDENTMDSLLSIDRALTDTLSKKGYSRKFQAALHKEAILYADRFFPKTAKDPGRIISEMEGYTTVIPVAGMVASSKDLAYTFGKIQVRDSKYKDLDKYQYLRIWKRDKTGGWKILVDLTNLQ